MVGVQAVSIALRHHLTGVLRCRHVGAKATRPDPLFERHLRAEGKSDGTVETDLEAVRLLEAFLAGRGVGLAEAGLAHIEAFLCDVLARWKPRNRYRSLQVFNAWLEQEGEITADPMAKLPHPHPALPRPQRGAHGPVHGRVLSVTS